MKNRIIDVQNVKITISKEELDDYICITDIAKVKSNSSSALTRIHLALLPLTRKWQ